MQNLSEHNIFIFLVQLFVLLGLARGLGELFRKWKQPPLTAEILVGILLGPTILGRFLPGWHQAIFPADPVQQNMLETVAWIGVLFLLLETGLEIDFSSAWRQRGKALAIALWDVIIPMIVAFVPCYFLPGAFLADPERRIIFALFMATIMTISDLPITARAMHDLKLSKTDLGFLIISALSVNDLIGWLLFTLILGFFMQSGLSAVHILLIAAATIGFAALCLTIGRTLTDSALTKIKAKQLPQPGISLTFICLLGLLCGAITQKIGIHALFGFFIAGIMAGGSKALSENVRQIISQMVYAIFVPLFFVNIGLKVDFLGSFNVFLVLLITAVGIAGKYYGAWLGAVATGLPKSNLQSIAIAHTPGGAMVIVIGMLAMENLLITEPMFVAIVFSAVASSVILGPWLGYSLRKRREISILEYFFHRAIIPRMQAATREQGIRELCGLAAGIDDSLDVEDICRNVLQRESTMGTAMEEGIAIPHARLAALKSPIVVFGRSLEGIEWNSPDDKPARLIFLILTPASDDDVQVQILGLIARVISRAQLRQDIMQCENADQIWTILHTAFTPQVIIRK
ncbi:MAG TPA: cation:proton antiporter [Anaerohalosphaeraceae bacterium]|nr:cation:proton antiporter [Anaerohalosphaeraceae bacterium]